jgi:hypothetical protein
VVKWFTYPPFDQAEFVAKALGRQLEGEPTRLPHFRRVEHPRYPHLVADSASEVEGILLATQLGDDWLLDAEFGVEQGFYRRIEVEWEGQSLWVMVGGPALAQVLQEEEESA